MLPILLICRIEDVASSWAGQVFDDSNVRRKAHVNLTVDGAAPHHPALPYVAEVVIEDVHHPLFPNPVVAEFLLDRLINTSHQVFMNGPSYRPNKRPGVSSPPGPRAATKITTRPGPGEFTRAQPLRN
jgi:hypothetical protein